MASEMKPCPFCGWEGASVVTDCGTSFVRCQDCEARTGSTDTGPIAAIARWNARPAPEYAGLVERLGDAELQRLLKDLTPYREKTIGSLRIDMGEVRKICRAVEVCDEAATALTALTERNKALEAEVERLRKLTAGQWFYTAGYDSEDCLDSPGDVLECLDMKPGRHVVGVDVATPLPSIWLAVHVRTNEEMDAAESYHRVIYTEHATEALATAALGDRP